tara:strand:- start:2761 stop:3084 length:324 start_codon:yes stop_codon:yes gene_type:complete
MNDFLSRKKNLFRKNLFQREKKRIEIIINLIDNNNQNDKFENILTKYKEIFIKKDKEKKEKINALKYTAHYLRKQINQKIESKENAYLINELYLELKKIEDIILQLK